MLDDHTVTHPNPHPHTDEYIWRHELNHFGWSSLLGHAPGAAEVSPYAAPARVDKLEGLAPAYIAVDTLDLFLEEDMEYARRLIRAGVPTELHSYPEVFTPSRWRVAQVYNRDYLNPLTRAFKQG